MAEKKGVGHAYNVDFLNVVFAASSLFLFFSVVWMVWDDFDRDWKNTQRQFAQLEYQVTQASLQQAGRSESSRSEEHTSELQSRRDLVCRLLLESFVAPPYLHSFPTRRSSDLLQRRLPERRLRGVQPVSVLLGRLDGVGRFRPRLEEHAAAIRAARVPGHPGQPAAGRALGIVQIGRAHV